MSITVGPLRRPVANASAATSCRQSGARERTDATFEMVELGCCEYRMVLVDIRVASVCIVLLCRVGL
jgi:hypothetical protein